MDQQIEDLFPFYALGVLTDEERVQVDVYIAADPAARARLAEMTQSAAMMPYAITPLEPSAQTKAALIKRIKADAPNRLAPAAQRPAFSLRRLFSSVPVMSIVAVASLLVAILVSVWALSLNNEVAALKRDLLAQREVLVQIVAPNTHAVAINGTQFQPGAHGQLIADLRGKAGVLIVSGLAPLQSGRIYQFWLIRGNQPVSAGLFSVDEQGRGLLSVQSDTEIGSFDAIGISIEPAAGSPQPTGDIVMLSKLS
jgi:anti-sigma-K factor RskA